MCHCVMLLQLLWIMPGMGLWDLACMLVASTMAQCIGHKHLHEVFQRHAGLRQIQA